MLRDFSQESLDRTIQLFSSLRADDNDQIADQAQQLKGKYGALLSCVGGSGLLNAIIMDNRQISSIKRSAEQSFLTTFANVSALDTPFCQNTLDSLVSLQTAIKALSASFSAYNSHLKGEGSHSPRYIASTGMSDIPVDSEYRKQQKAVLAALKKIEEINKIKDKSKWRKESHLFIIDVCKNSGNFPSDIQNLLNDTANTTIYKKKTLVTIAIKGAKIQELYTEKAKDFLSNFQDLAEHHIPTGSQPPVAPYGEEVDVRKKLHKGTKMPISYLKAFTEQLFIEETPVVYNGGFVFVCKEGPITSECVGMSGRMAGTQWGCKDTMATTVEGSYRNGLNKRPVSEDMERHDGMQLCRTKNAEDGTELFTHNATYWSEIDIKGETHTDVIVDIRGHAYPADIRDKINNNIPLTPDEQKKIAEIDAQNEREHKNPQWCQWDDPHNGYSKYAYAYDLPYADYDN